MPTKPSFNHIQLADLAAVIGGCGKKQAPQQQCPQCPPCPPPQAARPQGGAPEISTSVQITGYGSATGAQQ